MQATLTRNLFRRPQPTNEVEAKGFLDKNSVIEVVKIVEGQKIDGISTWYNASDGFFYWGGGVDKGMLPIIMAAAITDPFHSLINYNRSFFATIPQDFKDTKGKGVRIAVIDTGLNRSHPDLAGNNIKSLSNFTSSASDVNDVNGHGSHVVGLIGATASSSFGITGLAPLSDLHILKGVDDDGSTSASSLNKALKAAIDLDVDIINLSLDIAPIRFNIIEAEINRALEKGIIIIAAAGENELLFENDTCLCPANKNGIIAVGSCDESTISAAPKFQQKINFIIPNHFFWSCFNKSKTYSAERGSSMATAFVSAIFSLVKSFSKDLDRDGILNKVNEFSLKTSQFKPGETSLLNPFK